MMQWLQKMQEIEIKEVVILQKIGGVPTTIDQTQRTTNLISSKDLLKNIRKKRQSLTSRLFSSALFSLDSGGGWSTRSPLMARHRLVPWRVQIGSQDKKELF